MIEQTDPRMSSLNSSSPSGSPGMDVVSAAGSTENGFGFYVEEVKFFMMDMGVDWTFLVKRAAALPDDGSFCQVLSTEIPEISDRKFAKDMEELTRQAMPIEAAKGPKIVFFGKIPHRLVERLKAVERLRFATGGKVSVFPFPDMLVSEVRGLCAKPKLKSDALRVLLYPYFQFLKATEPQWFLESPSHPGRAQLCGRMAMSVVAYYSESKKEHYVFAVWDADNSVWGFPGGDIARGLDKCIEDCAERQWDKTCLGFKWEDCVDEDIDPLVRTKNIISEFQNDSYSDNKIVCLSQSHKLLS